MNERSIIILIDRGHGLLTRGKASPDGKYKEWEWCDRCARRIVAELQARGYDARLLVPESDDVTLARRVWRVGQAVKEAGSAKRVMLVSVHTNAAGMGTEWLSARGWCVYTSPGQTMGDRLATHIYQAVEQSLTTAGYRTTFSSAALADRCMMRSDWRDGDCDYEAAYYILTKTACPACLTENLFHDNRDDVSWLQSERGLNALVQGHVSGIEAYITELCAS